MTQAGGARRGDRDYDLVVWGATGFTGRLVAEYIAAHAPPALRWALGGRDTRKLEEIRRGLPDAQASLPIVVHDASSDSSMRDLARSASVVCTTVGPYMKYGFELARACAHEGTDYCDITGEVPFIRKVIDACHDVAERSHSRIVHTCGFDSIPSDLGVFLLADYAGEPLADVRLVVTDARGGMSGGTVASALGIIDTVRRDPDMRRLLASARALVPNAPPRTGPKPPRRPPIDWDPELRSFVAPFPMAVVNVRVVHRSNALFGYRYGEPLEYRETMIAGRSIAGLPGAIGTTVGVAGFAGLASFGPTRKWLEGKLPKPGDGPSERRRKSGYFKMTLFGSRVSDRSPSVVAFVEGTSDPGYGETAKMLGESAMCLALDPKVDGFEGGVLTPATAMGHTLVERLRKAGMRFEVRST